MANANKGVGASIILPFGVKYRDQGGPIGSYPRNSGNDYHDSFFAEVDDWRDAVADAMSYADPSQDYDDAMPESVGIWMAVEYGTNISPDAGHKFPDHDFSYGLRKRGITPTFSISPFAGAVATPAIKRMYDKDDPVAPYAGAESPGMRTPTPTLGSPSQTFPLGDWSNTSNDRNWAQRILDGDLDEWLDDFAQAAIAYKAITAPSGQSQPNPATTKNDKDEFYSAYDGIIVRFAFEMNGELGHSAPRLGSGGNPAGKTQRGIDELIAAWAYVSNRVRRTNLATNVHFFFCPTVVFNPDIVGYVPNNHFKPNKLVAGGLVQFLGLDYYGVGPIHGKQLYIGTLDGKDHPNWTSYRHVYFNSSWGAMSLPMIIGEYGIPYTFGAPEDRGLAYEDWDCDSISSGAYNERCRGRILDLSRLELVDRCANGPGKEPFRALRAVFYMATDLDTVNGAPNHPVGSTCNQSLPTDAWALWGESQPLLYRDANGVWELEQYLTAAGPPCVAEDREKRGTLGGMATGSWPGGTNSQKFAAWNWARQRQTWKWRGKGGALFKSLE